MHDQEETGKISMKSPGNFQKWTEREKSQK